MKENSIKILNYYINLSIDDIDFKSFPYIINTINPHSYFIAKHDYIFKCALLESDFLAPDGIGIVLASKILQRTSLKRVTGADIHSYLLKFAEKNSWKVIYLGSTYNTLQKIKVRLSVEYPNIKFYGYSPPFKSEFNEIDNAKIISIINKVHPNIVFLGMTAPKQEKWVYLNKSKLNTDIIASVGAVFDFYARTVKRPDKIWQHIGLEWLIRLIHEPKRLWFRTFVSMPVFIIDLFRELIKNTLSYIKKCKFLIC